MHKRIPSERAEERIGTAVQEGGETFVRGRKFTSGKFEITLQVYSAGKPTEMQFIAVSRKKVTLFNAGSSFSYETAINGS